MYLYLKFLLNESKNTNYSSPNLVRQCKEKKKKSDLGRCLRLLNVQADEHLPGPGIESRDYNFSPGKRNIIVFLIIYRLVD